MRHVGFSPVGLTPININMNNHTVTGHLDQFWDDSYKKFPYIRKPGFNQQEIDAWVEQGYIRENLNDFIGTMYDNSNPMPAWVYELNNKFGLHNQTYTFYRMDTLEIMPVHVDHFRTYCKLNNVVREKVYRVLVMLEDWKPGHYLEMDGIGYVNWKAGDWFKWRGDIPHSAANIGVEPRYTLQITGIDLDCGETNGLITVNIPDVDCEPITNELFVRDIFLPHAIPKLGNANKMAMAYTGNMYITELDYIDHTTELKDDIHIYLCEPLCSYLRGEPLNTDHVFYSEFSNDLDYTEMRSLELDSIHNYAKRNNMKVVVHSGDYNAAKYYPYYADRIELVCDDVYLCGCRKISGLNEEPNTEFNKKFISLNWRFAKHRQLIATYLASEDGYLSWFHRYDFEGLNKYQHHQYIDITQLETTNNRLYNKLKNNCELILANAPYTLDVTSDKPTEIENKSPVIDIWPVTEEYPTGVSPSITNKVTNSLEPYYRDAFVDIVTESRFAQPTANISEKVFQAIQYQKPFILVAPPYSLEYLKTFGFKTFDSFWDESYDTEENHELRLLKIFDVIDMVLSKSVDELREMYKEMMPIIKHNLDTFKQLDWNRR